MTVEVRVAPGVWEERQILEKCYLLSSVFFPCFLEGAGKEWELDLTLLFRHALAGPANVTGRVGESPSVLSSIYSQFMAASSTGKLEKEAAPSALSAPGRARLNLACREWILPLCPKWKGRSWWLPALQSKWALLSLMLYSVIKIKSSLMEIR